MGTINSAFSLISQGLDADQAALSVVANNVANANTPGYTEETPNWQENQPININGVSCGDGVTETGTTSVRDSVLDERLDQQQQLAVPVWRGAPRPPPESPDLSRKAQESEGQVRRPPRALP
jgi:flagellar hook-associated protein 1 FlgK